MCGCIRRASGGVCDRDLGLLFFGDLDAFGVQGVVVGLLEEWAYIRDWNSDRERSDHYEHVVHFYNHHRAHGALGWSTPMSTLKDNVPGHHN